MESIDIKGFKSIKELQLPLKPINILIGANGSGKSNFLSFFELLQNIYRKNLQGYVALNGGVDKFLYNGSKVTQEIEGKLTFPANSYSFTLKKGENNLTFSKETLSYYDNNYEVSNFSSETYVHSSESAKYIKDYLEEVRKYHFHDTGKNAPFHKTSNIKTDFLYLYSDGSNIAALLYKIKQEKPKTYNWILQTIQSIAPYFLDFVLNPNENGYIELLWRNKFSEQLYNTYNFSDGTLRFIALTTLLLQPKLPQTIIIDEPELGLHPFAIAKLAGLIKSASQRGCQIIVATQSVELINYFTPEDIITVDYKNGESVFERLDEASLAIWLEDFSLGELWKGNFINGQPF
ncbi:AAA family ATPase [uncultured Capnocytophaga sp.]|uniref:AAA family ATPase n=1 Tax=uncultured Capnocytophaga sp. TaxID=159273 RepID=UPI002598EB4B|nr:AAA family ATPase [uncultured Capnocytophaga sp.]